MIHVTKDNIRKILVRASLHDEIHICLPEHATSFTHTRLAPDINTKINDVYNPLNNNLNWLSTRIDLLQQDLDTIRKKDPQPATSIDICTITSIDSKFVAMEDSGLDSQAEWLQKEVKAIQSQLASQHQISASIDRARSKSIDSTAPATIDIHMVTSIDTTPDDEQLIHNKMESMNEELNELSAYAYNKI
ncbi:hypothetical protein DY000_02020152 [Brassica cretica]|uniref:Uncharacterized protein n=1 Tax=Brassica cretica TaxID=69181 RepID=A0ABQ7EKK5_BRACR|nr:hypothetical protein DY000_02020152 [Brassica cretica]